MKFLCTRGVPHTSRMPSHFMLSTVLRLKMLTPALAVTIVSCCKQLILSLSFYRWETKSRRNIFKMLHTAHSGLTAHWAPGNADANQRQDEQSEIKAPHNRVSTNGSAWINIYHYVSNKNKTHYFTPARVVVIKDQIVPSAGGTIKWYSYFGKQPSSFLNS